MTRLNLGPAHTLTVAAPVQRGGTLTVFAYGRAIELEVVQGETSEQVEQRMSALINASGVTTRASNGLLAVDLSRAR